MDIRFAQDLCENVMLSLVAKDIGHKIASRISALTGNVRNCGKAYLWWGATNDHQRTLRRAPEAVIPRPEVLRAANVAINLPHSCHYPCLQCARFCRVQMNAD